MTSKCLGLQQYILRCIMQSWDLIISRLKGSNHEVVRISALKLIYSILYLSDVSILRRLIKDCRSLLDPEPALLKEEFQQPLSTASLFGHTFLLSPSTGKPL